MPETISNDLWTGLDVSSKVKKSSPFYCGPQTKTMASALLVGRVIWTSSHWAWNQAGRQEVWPTGLLWSLAIREVEKQSKVTLTWNMRAQKERERQSKRGRRQKERNKILLSHMGEKEERITSQPMQCEIRGCERYMPRLKYTIKSWPRSHLLYC